MHAGAGMEGQGEGELGACSGHGPRAHAGASKGPPGQRRGQGLTVFPRLLVPRRRKSGLTGAGGGLPSGSLLEQGTLGAPPAAGSGARAGSGSLQGRARLLGSVLEAQTSHEHGFRKPSWWFRRAGMAAPQSRPIGPRFGGRGVAHLADALAGAGRQRAGRCRAWMPVVQVAGSVHAAQQRPHRCRQGAGGAGAALGSSEAPGALASFPRLLGALFPAAV